MSAYTDAFKVVQSLPGLTLAEQEYLTTVTMGEGFWGLGWGNPSPLTIRESAQFGIDPRAGVGSNNWGANQESGTANPPTFPHIDHHKDGTPYVGHFARYNTPQESAARTARILLKPNVRAAVNAGDLHGAVMAQHANGYFELNPEAYFATVATNYAQLTKILGWPPLLSPAPGGGAPLPLSSGFLSSDWGPESSSELSESEVLEHAENYLKGSPNVKT